MALNGSLCNTKFAKYFILQITEVFVCPSVFRYQEQPDEIIQLKKCWFYNQNLNIFFIINEKYFTDRKNLAN